MKAHAMPKSEMAKRFFTCTRCGAEAGWPCRSLQRGAWSTHQTIKGIHEERLELVDKFIEELKEYNEEQ